MKRIALTLAALAAAGLGGCMSSGSRTDAGTLSSTGRSSDTLGTQRRMDVYGGATAPVLPTMGAVGFGK